MSGLRLAAPDRARRARQRHPPDAPARRGELRTSSTGSRSRSPTASGRSSSTISGSSSHGRGRVVVDTSRGAPWATWFNGGRVNVARVCLHRWAGRRRGVRRPLRGRQARVADLPEASRQVTQLAEALLELGVGEGDRVAIYMPMCPAVAVAAHACAHIGAVQVRSSPASPRRRSRRASPTPGQGRDLADWSLRRGKRIDMRATLDEAGAQALQHVIEWSRETRTWPERRDAAARHARARRGRLRGAVSPRLHVRHDRQAERGAARAGRLPRLGRTRGRLPVRPQARGPDHFATDMGWIMGPWTIVGGGAAGATVVFAEGAPTGPQTGSGRLIESSR